MSNADLRHRMGAAGQRRAREHYDWRVVIAAYQELLADLTVRRRRRFLIRTIAWLAKMGVIRIGNANAKPLND